MYYNIVIWLLPSILSLAVSQEEKSLKSDEDCDDDDDDEWDADVLLAYK